MEVLKEMFFISVYVMGITMSITLTIGFIRNTLVQHKREQDKELIRKILSKAAQGIVKEDNKDDSK